MPRPAEGDPGRSRIYRIVAARPTAEVANRTTTTRHDVAHVDTTWTGDKKDVTLSETSRNETVRKTRVEGSMIRGSVETGRVKPGIVIKRLGGGAFVRAAGHIFPAVRAAAHIIIAFVRAAAHVLSVRPPTFSEDLRSLTAEFQDLSCPNRVPPNYPVTGNL